MNAISIVTRVIAILGAAAAAYFYFDLGNQLQETQQQLQSEQSRHTSTQNRLTAAEAEREELAETVTTLEANLQEAQGRIALEQARVEELESDLEESRSSLTAVQSERDEFRAEASRYRDMYLALREDRSSAIEGDDDELILSLQRELRRVEGDLETAQSRLRDLEGELDANGDLTRTLNVVRGKISDVDARRGFVMLDLGSNHDVRLGDELMVHRDGAYIARVRVSRSEPTQSVAQVLSRATEIDIRRGDDVRITKVQIN